MLQSKIYRIEGPVRTCELGKLKKSSGITRDFLISVRPLLFRLPKGQKKYDGNEELAKTFGRVQVQSVLMEQICFLFIIELARKKFGKDPKYFNCSQDKIITFEVIFKGKTKTFYLSNWREVGTWENAVHLAFLVTFLLLSLLAVTSTVRYRFQTTQNKTLVCPNNTILQVHF